LSLQIALAIAAAIGAYTRRETYHKFLSPRVALMFCACITRLFARIV